MKKLISLVLALALVLASCSIAFAAAAWTGNGGTKTITVNNAMNGETYSIYKLFDATTDGTNIAYTLIGSATEVPSQVAGIFEKKTITIGEGTAAKTYDAITEKGTPSDNDVQAALKAWAAANSTAKVGEIDCTNGKVEFTNLTDGYYVIISSFKGTVNKCIGTSTTTSGLTVYEKNTTTPQPVKTVEDHDYTIGQTIEYTVTFPGANYMGQGQNAKIVTSYEVKDTLPNFLSNAHVKSITIKNGTTDVSVTGLDFENKKFTIPWADYDETNKKWTSKYNNGSVVTIVYEAVLTDIVNVGTANINTVTITPNVDKGNGEEEPWNEHWEDDEEVYTYGAELEKIDGVSKEALAGATFQFKGLVASQTAEGVYTVTSYNASATDYTGASDLTVGSNSKLYIIGLDKVVTLTGKETVAPNGYNLLTSEFQLPAATALSKKVIKKTGYAEYDTKGNLVKWEEETFENATPETQDLTAIDPYKIQVENNKGTELPHTGGIGTTIFYILGGLLVVGAAVILVARRKASN